MIPVPLSVRLSVPGRDIHVTDELADLSFGSTSPGGYDTCTVQLHRPLTFTPAEVTQFARLYVYDGRSAATVWEGRLQDPGRSVGDAGEVFQLVAVGGNAHLSDRTLPYIIIDRLLDKFELFRLSTEHPKADRKVDDTDGGTPAIWLLAPTGTAWADSTTCTMAYTAIRNAGMKLGAYSVSGDCGRSTTAIWRWQTVTRDAVGAGTVDRNVDFNTGGQPSSLRIAGVSFPTGNDHLEFRVQQVSSTTQTANDDTWALFANFHVVALLKNKSGTDLPSPYPYGTTVAAHEVVEDLLGRCLPELDGPNATVATTAYTVDQLSYPDGVTPRDVLADLITLEPAYTWHVWESDPITGKFEFEWVAWPTAVRYEVDAGDGFDSPASGNTLFNKCRVRYRDAGGRTRSQLRTQAVPLLDANGLERTHFIDMGDETGTAAGAIRAADQFLLEHAAPVNAGRVQVTQPILDILGGRMVSPWEIRPGSLVRVRGVESQTDSLNSNGRDGLTIFKIAAMTYEASSATATLDLDTFAPTVARRIAQLSKNPPKRRR